MRMPAPFWSMTYSRSRRPHAHRCSCCNKIVQDGETVLMARRHKGTVVIHDTCRDAPYGAEGTPFTYRDFIEVRGMEHLAACGFRAAREWMETAPICRAVTP